MERQDNKYLDIPTTVSNNLLLGFGVDTAVAVVMITKNLNYIYDTARLQYVTIVMKVVSAM